MLVTTAKKNKRGMSLIEMGIVLTVASLFIGGIWAGANAVYRDYRVNLTIQQVNQVVQNLREYYAGTMRPNGWSDGTDITITVLDKKGLLPSEMRGETSLPLGDPSQFANHPLRAIKDTSGPKPVGSFQVIVSGVDPTKNTPIYKIKLAGIDKQNCIKLASIMSGSLPNGSDAIKVNGLYNIDVVNTTPGTYTIAYSNSISDIGSSACVEPSNNTIIASYFLHG